MYRHRLPLAALLACNLTAATLTLGESPSRVLLAEPKTGATSPFLPRLKSGIRLPVAVNGFCVVSLREQQRWVTGREAYQEIFDGQIYWFASLRTRAMFAANPQRYVPALAGDCVVTYEDTGVRTRGDPEHGLLHGQRLFFFASSSDKARFAAAPDRYRVADLACDGQCIVNQIDEGRQIAGLPETTTIVNGMRYRFAGLHQQRTFLTDMDHYGVFRTQPTPQTSTPTSNVAAPPPPLVPKIISPDGSGETEKSPPAQSAFARTLSDALDGYCPVTIREQGTWVEGKPGYAVQYDGQRYLMANAAKQQQFLQEPTVYLPALGGDCAVTWMDSKQRVPGTIYHASQFEERLYLFASDERKQEFKADPPSYTNADLAADGNCVVSLIDEDLTVPGRPELLRWHQGRRYYFASPEHQRKFKQNVELYRQP